MSLKRKTILRLLGDIGIITIGIVHAVIGKYYSVSIPPLALAFLGFSLMWLILGIVRLDYTISVLGCILEREKDKR